LEDSVDEKISLTEEHTNEYKSYLSPSKRSQRGLDWFCFFLSDVLNGVDSFLTAIAWGSQLIGFALSASSFTTMISQIPMGAIVDSVCNKKALITVGVISIPITALIIALWPVFWLFIVGQVILGIIEPLFCPVFSAI